MKTIIILLIVTASLLSCKSNNNSSTSNNTTDSTLKAGEYYTCPMHPSVHADKPGPCPICGMALVKKSEKK